MTTNYKRGYALEQKVKHFYESNGYIVIRSAGSHSPIDLVAIPTPEAIGRRIQFIQCKKTQLPKANIGNLQELIDIAIRCNALPVLACSIARKPFILTTVTSNQMILT